MIEYIEKFTKKETGAYHYTVYYSKKIVRYSMRENLPNSIVNYLTCEDGTCETLYTSTGKREIFRCPAKKTAAKTERTYIVTWDWLIGGKYWPQQKEIVATNATAACDVIKGKYIPGHTRFPFHVEAHRKEN